MASYGNTVLTGAGIDLVKRVIAKTATFEITRVATSSDSRLINATISAIEAMTALPSVNQTGTVTAFDTSNDKQVGLKCEFTNQGLTNPYNICGVGIYAKEAGKSEILFAVAPAKEPETMPAKPNDQSALFSFSLNMYVVVGQASAMLITATTEGVIKSINGTITPDANGNATMSYYSQAEVDQKVNSLSSAIDSLNSAKTNNTEFNALKNRVAANESGKADKSSVYDKGTADNRYLQRDASTTLKSGALLRWDDSGHANDGNNVPYMAGGLHWSGKTDSAEIRTEETGTDNLDLVFDLGDDGSNSVDFRWNNISKAKVNSSGKFTGHVDWANVDGKDTYSRSEIDSKVSTAVSNIRVGDRNLASGVASSKDWFTFNGFNGTTNYCYNLVDYSLDTLKVGDIVTFGITVQNEGVTSGTMIFQQCGSSSLWTRDYVNIGSAGNVTDFVPNGAEKALTYTIPITDGMLNGNSTYIIQIRTDNVPAGGTLSFRYAFVKKGTMATDWTPAPEDLEDDITSTKNVANAAKEKAEANANSIQALSDKINNEANARTDEDNSLSTRINDLTTTVTRNASTAAAATKKVDDRLTSLEDPGTNEKMALAKAGYLGDFSNLDDFMNALKSYSALSGSCIIADSRISGYNGAWFHFQSIPHRNGFWYQDDSEWVMAVLYPMVQYQPYFYVVELYNTDNNADIKIARIPDYNEIKALIDGEATNRQNGDNSVLSQAKAYTDMAKNTLVSTLNNTFYPKSDVDRLLAGKQDTSNVGEPKVLYDSTDLNNLKKCGDYFIENWSNQNTPLLGCWLYVQVQGVATRLTQTVWKDLDPATRFTRVFADDNWGKWVQMTKAV